VLNSHTVMVGDHRDGLQSERIKSAEVAGCWDHVASRSSTGKNQTRKHDEREIDVE
jgi:hypothetical protein